MTNRIQGIIPAMITPGQIGFIKGRHINDGFLYAQDVVTMATSQKEEGRLV